MAVEARMSKEEFIAIGERWCELGGPRWKHNVARMLGRSWNTVWCYAAGRRTIPQDVAESLWLFDRLYQQARAKLDAETEEQRRARFFATLEAARSFRPLPPPRVMADEHVVHPRPPNARVAEIAQLRASGCSNAHIAAKLGLRKRDVEKYVWKYGISLSGRIRYPGGKFNVGRRRS